MTIPNSSDVLVFHNTSQLRHPKIRRNFQEQPCLRALSRGGISAARGKASSSATRIRCHIRIFLGWTDNNLEVIVPFGSLRC